MSPVLPLKEAVADLQKQGIKVRYKTKARYVDGEVTCVGDRIKIKDDTHTLDDGEFWVPVYYDGGGHKISYSFVVPEGSTAEVCAAEDFTKDEQAVEVDPQERIEYYHDHYKRRSDYVISNGRTCKKSDLPPESSWEIAAGSGDAGSAHRNLSEAIGAIGDDAPKKLWAALFWAFRAGEYAERCEAWKSRRVAIEGESHVNEMNGRDGSLNKLKKWEKHVVNLINENPSVNYIDALVELHSEGFATPNHDSSRYSLGGVDFKTENFERKFNRLKTKLRKLELIL